MSWDEKDFKIGSVYQSLMLNSQGRPFIMTYHESCFDFDRLDKFTKESVEYITDDKRLLFTVIDKKPTYGKQFTILKIITNCKKYCMMIDNTNSSIDSCYYSIICPV